MSDDQTKHIIHYTAWEEGGYVLCINGHKFGEAVDTEEEAGVLVEWLKYSLDELIQITNS